jgi:D-glycero-D-manno-heptose 1,7-bisphosphate phosphatase
VKPAAFLDRDGVVCNYVDYLHKIEDFQIRPNSPEAIKKLNEAGFLVFVVTNQPMVAKGLLTIEELNKIHIKMIADLKQSGAKLDAVQFCPHSLDGIVAPWNIECECRKPKTGMLKQLTKDFPIDLDKSFFVGDTWRDIQCAQNFNLTSYGLTGGAGFPYDQNHPKSSVKPSRIFDSLIEVVDYHLNHV